MLFNCWLYRFFVHLFVCKQSYFLFLFDCQLFFLPKVKHNEIERWRHRNTYYKSEHVERCEVEGEVELEWGKILEFRPFWHR